MHRHPHTRTVSWLIALAALLAACAPLPPKPVTLPEAIAPDAATAVWQRIRIYIHWQRDEMPHWYVDALLAHRIAGPLLQRQRAALVLWRFHRRAADDAAGHSLSVLTYAAPATNDALCRALREDPLTVAMLRAGVLDKITCEGFGAERGHLVEATSDTHWSPALQRSWPFYIQGVSEMWLRLLEEHAQALGGANRAHDLDALLAFYQRVNEAVTATWQKEGQHAFLHHLNALFGYEPIDITEQRPRRF